MLEIHLEVVDSVVANYELAIANIVIDLERTYPHVCDDEIVERLRCKMVNSYLAVMNTIEKEVECLLKHHIHKRSHALNRVSKPGWLRFSFPLMYQTDVLEILGILTKLGYRDERMQEAVSLVVSKQDEERAHGEKNCVKN